MKIRSITFFTEPDILVDEKSLLRRNSFSNSVKSMFEDGGYEVQTLRLATPPFPLWLNPLTEENLITTALRLEMLAQESGFTYISLGSALPSYPDSYKMVPSCLKKTQNTFFSGVIADDSGICLPAVRACGKIIKRLAEIEPNGFGNLYFTALANVKPNAPFFPAAYGVSGKNGFALALEAADLAVDAFRAAGNLKEARENLIRIVEEQANRLTATGKKIEQEYDISFIGVDFTLAPYVIESTSLGAAMEQLGVSAVGLHGSLAAAAIITDTLDHANYQRTGFNGLMLPVLEDFQLAKRAEDGNLSVKDLLLYSCVCGTGLDTVPLPGDVAEEALVAVLLDLAAMSLRLNKQLTARLMPIPGKRAGELTGFDFPFFCNTRVMELESEPLQRLFAGSDETFKIESRKA